VTKFRAGPIQVKDLVLIAANSTAVVVHIGGQPARTLIDLGCLFDFMSKTLGDQLELCQEEFPTTSIVQLATLGPRPKVKY
jgi:hypothetical protein